MPPRGLPGKLPREMKFLWSLTKTWTGVRKPWIMNETVIYPGLDMVSRMDMMMTMLVDLTKRVNGHEKESIELLDTPHPTPSKARAGPSKSKQQNTTAQDLDLEETVQRCIKQCLWQFPLLEAFALQQDSSNDDDPIVKRTKGHLKSGRDDRCHVSQGADHLAT